MARRKIKSPKKRVASPEAEAGKRIVWLLEKLFDGNRSAMAREIGLSHTVIGRIANGQRPPGRHVLMAVAEHPKVSPAWVLTGVGEPLLAEAHGSSMGEWLLPISHQPLPGPPANNTGLLTGEFFPVPKSFFEPTRYWLEIQKRDLVVQASDERIAAGDLLLLETNNSYWSRESSLDGRICALRTAESDQIELAKIVWTPAGAENGPELEAEPFTNETAARPEETEITLRLNRDGSVSGRCKPLGRPRPTAPRFLPSISPDQVVAACLLLVRRQ